MTDEVSHYTPPEIMLPRVHVWASAIVAVMPTIKARARFLLIIFIVKLYKIPRLPY
jgi:hypothetical protein